MPVKAAMAAALCATAFWSSPGVYGVIPSPGKITCVSVIPQSSVSKIDDEPGLISIAYNRNDDIAHFVTALNLELKWDCRRQLNIFHGFILTNDGVELIPYYSLIRASISLDEICIAFNNFGREPAAVQYGKNYCGPSVVRSRISVESLCHGYEQPRTFQIGECAFGNFYAVAGSSPKQSGENPEDTCGRHQEACGKSKNPRRYGEPPFVRRFLEALSFIPASLGIGPLGGVWLHQGRHLPGAVCLGTASLLFFVGVAIIILTIDPETWEWWI